MTIPSGQKHLLLLKESIGSLVPEMRFAVSKISGSSYLSPAPLSHVANALCKANLCASGNEMTLGT